MKNFHGVNFFSVLFNPQFFFFLPFIFLTVDDYSVDERLESFQCLVYYQVSGEPGIVTQSSIRHLPGGMWTACTYLFIDHHHVSFFEAWFIAQFIARFVARFVARFKGPKIRRSLVQFVAQFVARFVARFLARFIAQFVARFLARFIAQFVA